MDEDMCPVCGLPKDLCVCSDISKETAIIEIRTEKRKFGKIYTIVSGIPGKKEDIKPILKKLKTKLGCGGTINNKVIELQGEQVNDVKNILIDLGFPKESIHINKNKKK